MHGVGHMSLPIMQSVVHGISTALAHLDSDGSTVAPGVTPFAGAADAADRRRPVRQRAWSQADPTLARAVGPLGCHPRRRPQLRRAPPHSSDCPVPSDGDRPARRVIRSSPSTNLWTSDLG